MPIGRFAFALFGLSQGQALSGFEVKIKDERTGEFIASTNPVNNQLQIHDNNDGTYYVDGWTMSVFSVYVGSDEAPQDELRYQVPVNDQVLDHLSAGSDVHGAAGQLLGRGDVVNTLTSTATDVPLSAAQGKTLDETKAAASHTHQEAEISDLDKYSRSELDALLAGKIIEAVDTTDFDASGGTLTLKDRALLTGVFIDPQYSLTRNLRNLDDQVNALNVGQVTNLPEVDLTVLNAPLAEIGANEGKLFYWQEQIGSTYYRRLSIIVRDGWDINGNAQYVRIDLMENSYMATG